MPIISKNRLEKIYDQKIKDDEREHNYLKYNYSRNIYNSDKIIKNNIEIPLLKIHKGIPDLSKAPFFAIADSELNSQDVLINKLNHARSESRLNSESDVTNEP